jgi:hypothetical protein
MSDELDSELRVAVSVHSMEFALHRLGAMREPVVRYQEDIIAMQNAVIKSLKADAEILYLWVEANLGK